MEPNVDTSVDIKVCRAAEIESATLDMKADTLPDFSALGLDAIVPACDLENPESCEACQ